MKTTSTLLDKIAEVLRPLVGREAALSAHDIAIEVGSNSRTVRRLIADHSDELWDREIPVISDGNHGFYCGEDLEQLQRMRDYCHGMGMKFMDKAAAIERRCSKRGIKLPEARR